MNFVAAFSGKKESRRISFEEVQVFLIFPDGDIKYAT